MFTADQFIAFFSSPFFNWLIKGILIYLSALWLAIVIWVTRDILKRSDNLIFQVLVILLNIILPIFGLILYLIIRPSKTLLEKYYEDLEYHFLSEQSFEKETCSSCEATLSSDFLYCPLCSEKVKRACSHCKRIYDEQFVICPYCGKKSMKSVKRTSS